MVAWREFIVNWLVKLEQSIVVLRGELSLTQVICYVNYLCLYVLCLYLLPAHPPVRL